MSKTTIQAQAWYAPIEYRIDPTKHDVSTLDLGYALEFTTPKFWVVALLIRAGVDPAAVTALDDVSRKIIENREAVLSRELERILPEAKAPGRVLAILANNNPWSLFVDSAQHLELTAPERRRASSATVEKLLEQYIFKILKIEVQGDAADDDMSPAPWIHMPRPVVLPLPSHT